MDFLGTLLELLIAVEKFGQAFQENKKERGRDMMFIFVLWSSSLGKDDDCAHNDDCDDDGDDAWE